MKKYFIVLDQKCSKRKIKRSIENNLNTDLSQKVNISKNSTNKPGIQL